MYIITLLSLTLNAYLYFKFNKLKELSKDKDIKNKFMASYIADVEAKKKN
jgi:hypothetical protein